MSKKATDIIAYIGIIGWVVAYFVGTKEESKFHLNQALVLALAEIVLGLVTRILKVVPVIGSIAAGVLSIALFVLWVMGLVSAIQQEDKEVPVLGGITILK